MSDDSDSIPSGGSKALQANIEPGKTATYHTGNATIQFELVFEDGTIIETVLGPNSALKYTRGSKTIPTITLNILPEARSGPQSID